MQDDRRGFPRFPEGFSTVFFSGQQILPGVIRVSRAREITCRDALVPKNPLSLAMN
jgi:hypothetical protein